MATIDDYQTKAGKRYMVRYRTPDRKQTTKRGFRTKRDAEQWLNKNETDIATGQFIHPMAGKATISDLGSAWLDRKQHLKPSTLHSLESTWRNHVLPIWGDYPISAIKFTDVQHWVTRLHKGELSTKPPVKGKSPTTVIRAFGILSGILDDAVKDNLLPRNPTDGVELPRKVKKSRVYLSHEQVHAFAEQSKYPEIILVLSYCGLRWGELAALRVRDMNPLKRRLSIEQNAVFVGGTVHVGTPKTHERRTVPYPRFLGERLEQLVDGRHPDDLIFPGRDYRHMRAPQTSEGEQSWFKAASTAAGLPNVTPHELRHTAASLAVSSGANVKAVQRMLGHKSAAMTLDTYADLFDSDLDAVADAMDNAVSQMNVVKMCSDRDSEDTTKPLQPRNHAVEGA